MDANLPLNKLSIELLDALENTLAAYALAKHASKMHSVGHLSIALSGGLDSMVMLHLCAMLKKRKPDLFPNVINAIHVNHGISEHANAWQQFCEQQCNLRNIQFHCKSHPVKKRRQASLEADARNIRYQLISDYVHEQKLKDSLQPISAEQTKACVLLAQHQSDQAETFLLQLKRGAGTKGLSSMAAQTQANEFVYLRPLLGFSQAQLKQFALHEGLEWIEDESNKDEQYDRNFLRHKIIPLLSARWPQINATIARSAQHCADAQVVNDEYMQIIANKVLASDLSAKIKPLSELSKPTQLSFLRFWLAKYLNDMPSQAQLSQVSHLLNNEQNTTGYVKLQSWFIEKFQAHLFISPSAKVEPQAVSLVAKVQVINELWYCEQLGEMSEIQRPCDKQVTVIKAPAQGLRIDYKQSSLRGKFSPKRPRKSLKVWFQEWGISPMQRLQCPIIMYETEIVAVLLPNGEVKQALEPAFEKSVLNNFALVYSSDLTLGCNK